MHKTAKNPGNTKVITIIAVVIFILAGLSLVLNKKYNRTNITSGNIPVTTTSSPATKTTNPINATGADSSGNIDTDVKSIDDKLKSLDDDQTKTDKALSDTPIDNGQ